MSGEEKAIFVGLRDDAQKALTGAAQKAGTFVDDTADGVEKNLNSHIANDADLTGRFGAVGDRPPEQVPLVNPDSAAAANPGARPGSGPLTDDDVPGAGVDSGGAGSAQTGPTDPVDLVSGALLESVVDLCLPGVLPLVLRRVYASSYPHGALLGPGWSSTLDIRLLLGAGGEVRFLGDDAQCLDYGVPLGIRLGLPSFPAYGARWALNRDAGDGMWTVTNPRTGTCYRFASEGAVRPLAMIRDQAGNEIRVHRDERGLPVLVEHSGGYRIRVAQVVTPAGVRIAGYRVETATSTTISLVGFDYDVAGRLVSVADSTGAAHCYEYDEHDRICAWIDRAGYRYPYRYDRDGRVVEAGEPGGFKHAVISYDRAARMTRVTDARGHTSSFHYDRFQQITKIVDPLNAETRVRKDAYGQLLEHTSPLGHTTVFEYDTNGNRTRVRFPDGQSASMGYHGPGRLARVDLPDGASWRYSYDERGNIASETDPLGAVTTFAYDGQGAVSEIIEPLGAVQHYENDAAGLPINAVDPRGGRTTITRDIFGKVTAIRTSDGAISRIERDSEGRVLAQVSPDGAVTRYCYDEVGNQVGIIDPSGRTTTIGYGPFHTPVNRINPDGTRYDFGYDAELQLTTVTGPTGLQWAYWYDETGRRVAERDFDGRVQTYEFDHDARLALHIAPDGVSTTYERDAAGRLIELRAGQDVSRFAYDAVGRLIRATNASSDLTITRDLLGRTSAETVDGHTVTRTYDPAGNLVGRTTPSGAHSRWAYDAVGDVASLTAGTQTLAYTRDTLGREIRREVGQVALNQTYDAAGSLTGQRLVAGERLLQERTYGYDADGLPTRITDLLRGTFDLELDRAGRITGVTGADHRERYAYDAVGNITASHLPQAPVESAAADASGPRSVTGTRIVHAGRTNYTYDTRGRLTGKTRRTLSGQRLSWSYTWDTRDRLSTVTRPDGRQWSYRYDALGRRIEKARLDAEGHTGHVTRFVWDGTVVVEQSSIGPRNQSVTTTWDYEPGGYHPAAQRRFTQAAPDLAASIPPGSPGTRTDSGGTDDERIDAEFWAIVTDPTGRPQELVTRDGDIDWTQRTLLWGRQLDLEEPAPEHVICPIGFPGQYHDPETGLYYNNQRYYDPDTAAYLSPDPVGLDAAPHPQAYLPNPLAAADPLGLTPEAPTTPRKTDDELQADADTIHEGFRKYYADRTSPEAGDMAYNKATVSTYQADDGSLYYSVNRSKTYPGMDDLARGMGYKRINGVKYMGPEQTDAEQIMLNAVDKSAVPDTGRIATSRVPCQAFRNTGKAAQNCAARIASYVGIRLVGRFGRR
jgi:RHS repeat-associated protein